MPLTTNRRTVCSMSSCNVQSKRWDIMPVINGLRIQTSCNSGQTSCNAASGWAGSVAASPCGGAHLSGKSSCNALTEWIGERFP
jgi:hypothetical protein